MNDVARGARTRACLVAAAIELFDRDGYERTSLNAVCRRVSVTKGALYRHFPSKQALATAVVEELFRTWHDVRDDLERAGVGPLQTLVDVTHRMSARTLVDPSVRVGARLLFTSDLFELLAGTHFVCLAVMVRDLLDRALAGGELRPEADVRAEAEQITAVVVGAQALGAITSGEVDRLTPLWQNMLPRLTTAEARGRVRAHPPGAPALTGVGPST
ncbi:TetR/AcrR family transcriptional regulator [Saccharothrix coeruleofusca]|uniref:HTH tetR-type domain-containing protein n=1 Tax=Saccharothrix coeruleofusca TaxID=33919 RepID=A0A918ANY4_9PSEU|nr:TetR/AcrR family transcriptional regulator [Saccharothrix coeruleofusca]MBP2336571.1 AcrR family transcriptional regulator [Saccharothrix coeruleofusca]GGP52066.1 hypothetical protein GCM10010185_25170 [Saccharothrix coeruleofusca]